MARSQPLPLSEVRSGHWGADFEDLRWYFCESSAAQSGLHSSQAAFERRMIRGVSLPPPVHHFDFRRREHIRRAKKIELKLAALPWPIRRCLWHYFTDFLPRIEAFKAEGKAGRKAAAKLLAQTNAPFSVAMRAYGRQT